MKFFALLIVSAITSFAAADGIEGKWVWIGNSDKSTFTLSIVKNNEMYIGSYCAVAEGGSRIDCSTNSKKSFEFSSEVELPIEFSFKTYYWNDSCLGGLSWNSENLIWTIQKCNRFGSYAPKIAELKYDRESPNK